MLEPAIEEYLYRRGNGQSTQPPTIDHPEGSARNQLSFIEGSEAAIGHKEVAAQEARKKAEKEQKAQEKAKSKWGILKAAVKVGATKGGKTVEKVKNTVIPPKPIPGADPKAPPVIGWQAAQEAEAKMTDKQKKKIEKAPAFRASTGKWE